MAEVENSVVVDHAEKVIDEILLINLLVLIMLENMLAHIESIHRIVD